ncbi:MAG: hypothetical protein DRP47_05610 [Candidatus Zixiibacteriota bacterium]|nr:MAG: hypothetical protein DRP47_05610 [candidate division Zixibacteria bacterium]
MLKNYFMFIRLFSIIIICLGLAVVSCDGEDDNGTGSENSSGQISLAQVDGLYNDTSIQTGVPITFSFRLNNNTGSAINGLTHGFKVYSYQNAVLWDTTVGEVSETIAGDMFDGGFFIVPFSTNGSNVDTIGFGGFKLLGTGIPDGFNDIAFTIRIGPIDAAYHGQRICLDSSFYPPGGAWLWSTEDGSIIPDWDGARWFRIVDPTAK